MNASGAASQAIGVLLGDLAGLLVVRDRIPDADFQFLNAPWREVIGRDAGE